MAFDNELTLDPNYLSAFYINGTTLGELGRYPPTLIPMVAHLTIILLVLFLPEITIVNSHEEFDMRDPTVLASSSW